MVVPLAVTTLAAHDLPSQLCPLILVKGKNLMLVVFEAAPLGRRLLKNKVVPVRHRASDIIAAMDAVVSGV